MNPFGYNLKSRCRNRAKRFSSRPVSRNSDVFGYNERSEVTGAIVSNIAAEYGYDEIGNSTSFTANSLNQYSQFQYDSDGNLLSDGVYAFVYDSHNRLKTVSSNGVLLVTNYYDVKSRRVRKVTPNATMTFFYDDWNLIEERIVYTNGTASTIKYYWGKDLSGSLQGAGGIGGLLYLTVDDSIYIPCYDNNGNITKYIDANGNMVASYTYNAFGRLISKSGVLADFFRHRFSTKHFDTETELYYYGYRFYHPVLMRWLNRDPIEEDGGLNLYGFCGNRSCYTIDSFGLRISMFIERKLNEKSINYRRRGTGRGFVSVELIRISMYCSRCIFKTSGQYSKIMYILSPDNIRWNRRLTRYNVKWGNPRSNLKERDATIAHEMDHWNSWLKVEEFILYLNSLDGKFLFFCESKAAKLKKEFDSLVIDAKRESLRYDDELNMNQGGMNK